MIILIDPSVFCPKKHGFFKLFRLYAREGCFGYFNEELPHRKIVSRNSL